MLKIRALLKSKGFMYVLIALFSLLLACLSSEYDFDLYARLIVGEHFFKTGWIAYEDFLSYTPTHLWYDHEWGSSLVFYAFLKLFGNFGLILVQAITIFFTTFFVIKTQQLQKHAYPTSLAFIVGFMCLYFHQNPSIVRCHMFSFMLFSMLLYFLEKTRLQKSNILWLMPPIVILWNNLHGGVVSGLGMIFIYMIGEMISRKPWLKYFGVLAVSTPLLVINPYGADYLNFLVSANTKNREYITEWWGIFVQRHVLYYYPIFIPIVFTVITAVANIFAKKRWNITKTLALITTAALGMIHIKLFSLGLITAAALFYNELISLISKNGLRFLNKAAYVCLSLALLYLPFTKPTVARTSLVKFPVQEVEFLKQNKIAGNLITAFGLGSYTSYKLYPQNLIYMDGRYEEVYYDREFDCLVDYEKAETPLWLMALTHYPTEILMPEKAMPVYKKLKAPDSEWEEVYSGNVCGVFLPKKRTRYKGPFIMPAQDLKYYQDREFENLGSFGK